ncbi:helix-turn-helix domain-containing protein [Paraburkholderia caribensis]|uniref:AraC family transcriptional regulator n=1 Tax=Paraburkholderia caribensis TaxID=75105 RepID=A0A9Q6S7G2_9BURK|nr:helix-turn-helix domain-containing protein [Paraburkholderia caribensis]MCO4880884.1 helix-turn-helix domain-containing protein [Paraburkholderia caribensis]PTB24647.1 AraC family transcriptional regulator [Paraburkholderia caribensis]QLB66562.1 AraC family transcriptional regulator [Paraburkholderia caribensis]CAG9226112.1 AraC family transcriptional regulator [Paraburkholderia caribensis]
MKTTYHDVSRSPNRSFPYQTPSVGTYVIGIFVFDGFSILPAVEVADVFDKANQVLAGGHDDTPRYRTVFISSHGGCVSSSAHIDVFTQSAEQFCTARAVFVASGEMAVGMTRNGRFSERLRGTIAQSDEVFVIGSCEASQAVVSESSRTSAGDLQPVYPTGNNTSDHASRPAVRHALGLISQDFGLSVLRRVLEHLPDTRLAEFNAITANGAKSIREKIHESARWITRNCNKPISITVAAQTAGMSDRSYLRHFRAEMGVKPSEHLRRSRVELAAAMLTSSDLPVDKIARRCGLTSGECLARLFRQVLDISPTEYRSRACSQNTEAREFIFVHPLLLNVTGK